MYGLFIAIGLSASALWALRCGQIILKSGPRSSITQHAAVIGPVAVLGIACFGIRHAVSPEYDRTFLWICISLSLVVVLAMSWLAFLDLAKRLRD